MKPEIIESFDPNKASEILKKMGAKDSNNDGVMEHKGKSMAYENYRI